MQFINHNCARSYWSLAISQSVAKIADAMYYVTLVDFLCAYINTSLELQVLLSIASLVIAIGTSFLAPLIYQRLSLFRLLITARALEVLFLAGLILFVQYFRIAWLLLPGAIIFFSLLALCEGVISSARNSYWIHIVESNDLERSNQLIFGMIYPLGMCIGYFARLNFTNFITYSFLLILSLWLLSFLLTLLIKVKPKNLTKQSEDLSIRALFRSGWGYVYRHKVYRYLFLSEAMHMLAFGIWGAPVLRRFIQIILEEDFQPWFSYFQGAYKFGSFLSGALIIFLLVKSISSTAMLRFDAVSNIFLMLLFIIWPNVWFEMFLCLLMGITHSLRLTAYHTLIQYHTLRSKLPQVYAVHKMIWYIGWIVSGYIMAYIVDNNIYAVYILATLFFIASAFFVRCVRLEIRNNAELEAG